MLTSRLVGFIVVLIAAGCQSEQGSGSGGPPPQPISASALVNSPNSNALGVDARWILEAPDAVEIVSLAPGFDLAAIEDRTSPRYHGQLDRGHAVIANDADRKAFVSLFYQSMKEAGPVASCFLPHHGATVTRGGRKIDLVICFECGQAQIHGPTADAESSVVIGRGPEAKFDSLFGKYGLQRAR